VKNHFKLACRIGLAVFLLCQFAGIARGDGLSTPAGDTDPASLQVVEMDEFVDVDDSVENVVPEETSPPPAARGAHLVSEAHAGYRFYNRDGNVGRAAEYEYLHSNPIVFGLLDYLELDNKFAMEGNFLNDRDYYGDLSYDHKGLYRLQLRTESLFHNLDHESPFSDKSFTLGTNDYLPDYRNRGASYGVRVEQDLARFRYKLPHYPLHLNLEYWRMTKEGSMQQRYADQAFEGGPNTIFAQSRKIDHQTHEGNIVFDTHLGLVDLIYDFRIREFGDLSDTPSDSFIARAIATPNPGYVQHGAGFLPHDETPDSRFYSHTVKLHTSLSGGIVGAASYTFAKRENRSSLSDIQRADQTADTMHNVAGDFTYTPCGFFSMAIKYRRQEVDRDAPDTLTTTNAAYVNPVFSVRPAIDTVRDSVTATLSFLPIRLLTIKGEYKGEFLSRDNLDGWNRPGVTASTILPEKVNVHKGTLTLLSRPLKGLRLKAQYSYSSSDHAMYGNAYEQRHEGSFLATYNAPGRWGVTANTRIIRESSDHLTISSLDLVSPSVTVQLPRERELDNATFSLWFVPFRDLTVSGSYGLLRNSADQGVLFAGTQAGSVAPTDYTSQAQVYSISGLYRFSDKLDLSLILQQVRSFSKFTPGVADEGLSNEVQRISRTETRENSLSARGEYQFTKNISCLLDYSYRDYDDKSDGSLSGTLHTVSAFVRARW
jgi:hypothetical protein